MGPSCNIQSFVGYLTIPLLCLSPGESCAQLGPEIALQSVALRRCCDASEGYSCEPHEPHA